MSATPSPRSRIPIRTSSCPVPPSPRHWRVLHSTLITIPEGMKQSSADAILTRMPRVRYPDHLYESTIDKVLPQLPQPNKPTESLPDTELEITTSTPETTSDLLNGSTKECSSQSSTSPTPEDNQVTNDEEVARDLLVRQQVSTETVSLKEAAWGDFESQNQRLIKWFLSTELKIAMNESEAQITQINITQARHECLVSLLRDIVENDPHAQSLYGRAKYQNRALTQKASQLSNASRFVLERNSALIDDCEFYLDAVSMEQLDEEHEKAFKHAKESTMSQHSTHVSKGYGSFKQFESLKIFNHNVGTVIENLNYINGLLSMHDRFVENQVEKLRADIVATLSQKGSNATLFSQLLCFRQI
ncbi:hypothetical protein D6D01_01122 [Aureobasidium pullulans]|uniref:Uncharacterized protein n=1 Tax=Aureobasidium pullulans TaxID=5580 RepID=A0A4S9M075_AURPU|nr:hypothetical protein D6D01_01122 [Aureobasidium pullulans]